MLFRVRILPEAEIIDSRMTSTINKFSETAMKLDLHCTYALMSANTNKIPIA